MNAATRKYRCESSTPAEASRSAPPPLWLDPLHAPGVAPVDQRTKQTHPFDLTPPGCRRSFARSAPHAILIVAASLLVVRMFHLAHYPYPAMSASAVAYGSTEAPFHVRLLVPMIVRGLAEGTGVGTFEQWNLALQFAFVLASLAALFAWLRLFFAEPSALMGTLFAPVILLWSMDMPAADAFPQVLFFTLALVCLYQRRIVAFALIYFVAVTNRETIAALVLPFIVHCVQRPPAPGHTTQLAESSQLTRMRIAVLGLAGLMIAWVVIWKTWLGPLLSPADIANKVALFQVWTNLSLLTDWSHTFNPFAKNPFTILGYTWLLLPFAWRYLPRFVKMLCICWVPYLGLMLVVAKITETRVHMEWTPVALAVVVAAMESRFGRTDVVDQRLRRRRDASADGLLSGGLVV